MRDRRGVLRSVSYATAALFTASGASLEGFASAAVAQSSQPLSLPADGTSIDLRTIPTNGIFAEENSRSILSNFKYRRLGPDRIEVAIQRRRASDGQDFGPPQLSAGLPFLVLSPNARLDWSQLRPLLAGRVGSRATYAAVDPASATEPSTQRVGELLVADRRSMQTPLGLVEVIEYVDDYEISGTTAQGQNFRRKSTTRLLISPSLGVPVNIDHSSEFGQSQHSSIAYIEGINVPGIPVARMPFAAEARVEFMPPFWEARALGAIFQCNFDAGLANLQRPDRIGRRCDVMRVAHAPGRQILWNLEIEERRDRSRNIDVMAVQRVLLAAYMETAPSRPPQELARRFGKHYGFSENDVNRAYRQDPTIETVNGQYFTLSIGRQTLSISRRG